MSIVFIKCIPPRENGVKFMVLDQYFFDPSVQASLKLINNKFMLQEHKYIFGDVRGI